MTSIMTSQRLSFLVYLYQISTVHLFITRLPSCGRYFANFTERRTGEYFQGVVGATLEDITRMDCSLECLFHDGCVFINHKMDDSKCELITSHIGAYITSSEYQVVSTNYQLAPLLRGPFCRYLGVADCAYDEICVDTCESPGYKCVRHNKAQGKSQDASGRFKGDLGPNNALDGELNTYWRSNYDKSKYIEIDLEVTYMVIYVVLYNSEKSHQMQNVMRNIQIEVSGKLCKDGIDQRKIPYVVHWCPTPLKGQHVKISQTTRLKVTLVLSEIVVGVL